jgi:antitoxin (DNA-binding transcriptional repressor) of toxin-antitoxin stability system
VKTIKLSKASRPLSEYAAVLGEEIVVLTEGNRPVAAIVPLKASDRESIALSGHPEFLDVIAQSRAELREGHTVSLEEMRQLFPSSNSLDKHVQPTKARRRPHAKRPARRRLRS